MFIASIDFCIIRYEEIADMLQTGRYRMISSPKPEISQEKLFISHSKSVKFVWVFHSFFHFGQNFET